MTRKRRADAWDCTLTEAQRWDAYEKSKGLPWQTFAAWVAEEYGLTPGKNALYDWQEILNKMPFAEQLRTLCSITAESRVRRLPRHPSGTRGTHRLPTRRPTGRGACTAP